MRLKPVFFILLFSCVLLLLTSIPAFASNFGYFPVDGNIGDENQIIKFDIGDYSVIQTLQVNEPAKDMVMSPDGSKYYVLANNGMATDGIKTYSVSTNNVINSLTLGPITTVYNTLYITKSGNTIFLVCNNRFYKINAQDLSIITNISVSESDTVGYASITSDEENMYIPGYNGYYWIRLNILPLQVNKYTNMVQGSGRASLIDKNNNYIYFTVYNTTNQLQVYNLNTKTKVGQTELGTALPLDIALSPSGEEIGLPYNNKIAWISTSTYQFTDNTTINGAMWISSDVDNTRWYVSCPARSQIIVLDPSTKTTLSTISITGSPGKVVVGEINNENADIYAPHNVRYTLTSYIKVYHNITCDVYDINNKYIVGGVTDDSGSIVFQLYSNKYYTINFNGSGINKTVSMYPIGTAYDIFIEPWSTWTWQPGSSQISDVDSVITAYINGEANGIDGTITVYYQDNGSTTENVLVTVYQRYNESTNQLIDFYMIEGSGVSSFNHQFNLTGVVGKDYLVKVDAHSSKYGDIVKYQTYNFPSARYGIPGVNDDYVYMVLGICIPLFIALAVSLRNVKFGPVVFCGASWAFVSLNWMTMFGLAYPLLLTVASIVSVVYLISMKEERR